METTTLDPYYLDKNRKWTFRYHAAQRRVMRSRARFVLVLAGLQSGKTIIGPWWLYREIVRRGPGDYLVASPTFRLLSMKCLPEYRRLFLDRLRLGTLRENPTPLLTFDAEDSYRIFGYETDTETRILFGHAQDPDSLESATAKAAHLDEAGQKKFKRASHESVLGRLSIHRGRILYTTTPYTLGWLKTEVFDRAVSDDPLYEVVQFRSTMNPAFPQSEYDERRRTMPPWKFRMRYDGLFERPAGSIYDCFYRERNTARRKVVEAKEGFKDWPRFLGLDFGGVNTAGVFLALDGTREAGTYYVYRTYHTGSRTAREHAAALMAGEAKMPYAVGGSGSEGQWRREFQQGGLSVREPAVTGPDSVEIGIDRVYGLIKAGRLVILDDLYDLTNEIESYSRELDENDLPTMKIEDKSSYHLADALRYVATHLVRETSVYGTSTIDF